MDIVEQSADSIKNEDSTLGTFKDVKSLKSAYDNLRSEFTRKSQALAELRKNMESDKAEVPQEMLDNTGNVMYDNAKDIVGQNDSDMSSNECQTSGNTMHFDDKNAVKTEKIDKNTASVNIKQDVVEEVVKEENLPFWQRKDWDVRVKEFLEQFDMDTMQRKELAKILCEDKDLEYQESPLHIAYARMLSKANVDIDKLVEDENFVESKILNNEKIRSKIINEYLGTLNANRMSVPKVMANSLGYGIGNKQMRKPRNLGDAYELAKKYFE